MKQSVERPGKDRNKNVVCIPYVKGVSEPLSRVLRPLGVRTIFKPFRTIANTVSKPKDPTPANAQRGVIYKIPCNDCPASYIGETGRKRDTRLKEHQRDVKYASHATRLKTELVDHSWTMGHSFDFAAATTLAREDRWGPRKLLESWFVRSDTSACNKNRGPLHEAYMDISYK